MTIEEERSALNAQIDDLVTASNAEHEALRRASRTTWIITTALLLVIVTFVSINYLRIRGDWTQERLAKSFGAQVEILQPAAVTELQVLGQALAPIYLQASREELSRMSPEIGKRIRGEMDSLGSHLRQDSHQRLEKVTERLGDHAESITFAAYPGLRAEDERERLTQAFKEATSKSVDRAIHNFSNLFATDVLSLEQQLRGFATTTQPDPEVDLDKHFIRLWLQLLDAEIAAQ